MSMDDLIRMANAILNPTPDKPRKIVVCHPDNVQRIQSGLVAEGITDVLVKPDPHGIVDIDQSYVMDPLPEIMSYEEMCSFERVWRESMDDLLRCQRPLDRDA